MKLLAERIDSYLEGVRASRDVAEKLKDQDTVDLLTGIIVGVREARLVPAREPRLR